MVGRVPVARGNHRETESGEPVDVAVKDGNDFVAPGNGEGAAGKEIILKVDDQEQVACAGTGLRSVLHIAVSPPENVLCVNAAVQRDPQRIRLMIQRGECEQYAAVIFPQKFNASR